MCPKCGSADVYVNYSVYDQLHNNGSGEVYYCCRSCGNIWWGGVADFVATMMKRYC